MFNFKAIFEAILNDVNKDDGITVRTMEKITDSMFLLIKWVGIPMVLYLLFAVSVW